MTRGAKRKSQHAGRQEIRPAYVHGVDQIWLINLSRRPDRLQRFMRNHPEMNGRINILAAYDGKHMKLTPALARLFAPNNFHWHKATIGCALSHLDLWQSLAAENDENAAYLVLEDDAQLDAAWLGKVEAAFLSGCVPLGWEILYLGGILPKYRDFFECNILRLNRSVATVRPDCAFGRNPIGYFHFCAYAYILSSRGARRLLELIRSWGGFYLQADFAACYAFSGMEPPRTVHFIHPLLAESFQDTAEGFVRPYDVPQAPIGGVDSDIWRETACFEPEEIAAAKVDGLPLDIRKALRSEP